MESPPGAKLPKAPGARCQGGPCSALVNDAIKVEFGSPAAPIGYRRLMQDRSGFKRAFCGWLAAEPGFRGRVLEIGCGGSFPEALRPLLGLWAQLDGVDPDPRIRGHPYLKERWEQSLEDSDIPEASYDLTYAYNVVEHIADPRRFLARLRIALKPGGVFWALTPHANHPFTWIVKTVETLGLRKRVSAFSIGETGASGINEYPAYYRANRARRILRSVDELGFSKVVFQYIPCTQWDRYFPCALRWAPHAYDFLLGVRFRPCMLIFAYRLEV